MSSFLATTRPSFPSLTNESKQIFLDNAGGTQMLGSVVDAISDYLRNSNVQMGASYKVGKIASERFRKGYAAAAGWIGAGVGEIVIGASTTQLLRNASHALTFPAGSELVLSKTDHEANIASWVALAVHQNLVIKWWIPKSTSNPKLLPEQLKELLSEKTVLVACTHASNILGSINDVKGIVQAVREGPSPDALVCVDAVAYMPDRKVDVKDLGADFYVFSWYKVYGPHISQLYASPRALAKLSTLTHFFNPSETLEDKLGLAASNYELTASIPHIVEYFGADTAAVFAEIAAHEEKLAEVLLTYLNSRKDIKVFGETTPNSTLRVPTISFVVDGMGSREVVERVEKETAFGLRWGAFYSNRLVHELLGLGEQGVVRVSMVHYNSLEEIQEFVKRFDEIVPPVKG